MYDLQRWSLAKLDPSFTVNRYGIYVSQMTTDMFRLS